MKALNHSLVLLVFLLSGCASKTTVYVYAKYLDTTQREEIRNVFDSSQKYRVQFNEFDFPASVTENTLLYSLILLEPETIDAAAALSTTAGFPIEYTQGLSQGNHWYTKNSMALFLLPKGKDNKLFFFRQDLVNEYKAQDCNETTSLHLHKDGSFTLKMTTKSTVSDRDMVTGEWKYRQYPFLELRKKEAAYADYYFEIKRFRGADKVSEIDFVELESLNTGSLPENCSFLIGTRI